MTPGLVARSILALLLGLIIATVGLTHAAILPRSAYEEVMQQSTDPTPGPTDTAAPTTTGYSTPVVQPTASPSPTALTSIIPWLPNVPGHIFYVDEHHSIHYIAGQYAISGPENPRGNWGLATVSVAPALSPNGRHLAWVAFNNSESEIEVADIVRYGPGGYVQGGATRELTQDHYPPPDLQAEPATPGVYDPRYWWWAMKPSWLPDSRRLVYLSDRPGFQYNSPDQATMSVFEQGITQSMTDAVKLSTPCPGSGGHDSPAWRPKDPTVFIFVDYCAAAPGLDQYGAIETAMAPPGTAAPPPVTALTPQQPGTVVYQPVWSPDSHFIVFVQDSGHNSTDLRVMPFHRPGYLADYNHAVTLVRGRPYIAQPFWSPDGRYLGYLTSDGGPFHLFICRVTRHGDTLTLGRPTLLYQAGNVSAEYRPTWGSR